MLEAQNTLVFIINPPVLTWKHVAAFIIIYGNNSEVRFYAKVKSAIGVNVGTSVPTWD